MRVRPATRADREPLNDMFLRCSKETRYRRFHGLVHSFPEPYISEVLGEAPWHFGLVAATYRKIVGLASLRLLDTDSAEVAILVDDGHQRQGIGDVMLGRLVDHADGVGIGRLIATVLADQMWAIRVLGAYGTYRWSLDFGVVEVTLQRGRAVPPGAEAAVVASRSATRSTVSNPRNSKWSHCAIGWEAARDPR